jgi:hypothetical protein
MGLCSIVAALVTLVTFTPVTRSNNHPMQGIKGCVHLYCCLLSTGQLSFHLSRVDTAVLKHGRVISSDGAYPELEAMRLFEIRMVIIIVFCWKNSKHISTAEFTASVRLSIHLLCATNLPFHCELAHIMVLIYSDWKQRLLPSPLPVPLPGEDSIDNRITVSIGDPADRAASS